MVVQGHHVRDKELHHFRNLEVIVAGIGDIFDKANRVVAAIPHHSRRHRWHSLDGVGVQFLQHGLQSAEGIASCLDTFRSGAQPCSFPIADR